MDVPGCGDPPGESPAEALIRRVPEETGLAIGVDHVIGARLHPRTGHFLRYLACFLALPQAASTASAQPGDPDADGVEWIPVDQVLELAPDLYPPVRLLIEMLA